DGPACGSVGLGATRQRLGVVKQDALARTERARAWNEPSVSVELDADDVEPRVADPLHAGQVGGAAGDEETDSNRQWPLLTQFPERVEVEPVGHARFGDLDQAGVRRLLEALLQRGGEILVAHTH